MGCGYGGLRDYRVSSLTKLNYENYNKHLNLGGAGLVTPATVRSNTSALKDQLKEKEQHIEQLLKERDLERSEVAKAASQTDEVEAKLSLVKQENEESNPLCRVDDFSPANHIIIRVMFILCKRKSTI